MIKVYLGGLYKHITNRHPNQKAIVKVQSIKFYTTVGQRFAPIIIYLLQSCHVSLCLCTLCLLPFFIIVVWQ